MIERDAALRALVAKWRDVDADGHAHDPAIAFAQGQLQCADELAALLAEAERPYSELRAKMSPEAQERSRLAAEALEAERPAVELCPHCGHPLSGHNNGACDRALCICAYTQFAKADPPASPAPPPWHRAKYGQCYIAGNGAVVHVRREGEPCECSQRVASPAPAAVEEDNEGQYTWGTGGPPDAD